MTNQEFASAYLNQARSIYRELKGHYENAEWHLVVRRAQESVELILKGFLRQMGLEVPRLHDVSHLLVQNKERLPRRVASSLDRILSISRRLRQERETSFYGDEDQELPPSALYTELDADRSKSDLEWLFSLVDTGNV